MNAQITSKQRGIPNYFKKVGLAVMILAFLLGVLAKTGTIEMAQHTKDLFKLFTLDGFLVGLLLIALAKGKVEDEMISAIKLRTMAFAFVFGVLIVIIRPIIDLISNDPITDVTGQEVVLQMLGVYLFVYYLQKRKLR